MMDEFTKQGLVEKSGFKDGLVGSSESSKTVPQDFSVTPDAYRIMPEMTASFSSTSTQMVPLLDSTRTVTTPCFVSAQSTSRVAAL